MQDGQIAVSQSEEVTQAKTSNPRTAIGVEDPLHYVVVVSDGRSDESEGLSLYELAAVLQAQGCSTAYLQVLSDNTGARAMYRQMGYEETYEYWFRIKRFETE